MRQALELALEALESAVRYHGIMLMSDPPQDAWKYHRVENKADKAITAIKEALAQPERDYERGFIDGMQKQMQSSVDKAVNAMSRTWVGLTRDELNMIGDSMRTWSSWTITNVYTAIEAKLKEKNNG